MEIWIALFCVMLIGYYVPMRYALTLAVVVKLIATMVG